MFKWKFPIKDHWYTMNHMIFKCFFQIFHRLAPPLSLDMENVETVNCNILVFSDFQKFKTLKWLSEAFWLVWRATFWFCYLYFPRIGKHLKFQTRASRLDGKLFVEVEQNVQICITARSHERKGSLQAMLGVYTFCSSHRFGKGQTG